MALAPPSTNFVQTIQTALIDAGMLNDKIVVLDPNSETTTPYDPVTDTGGESVPSIVIGPRPAYIKAIGATVVTEAALLQGLLRFRVQFLPEDSDPVIPKGMIVRVLPGGANPMLARFAMTVLGEPTGSISALSKLECQSSSVAAPVWTA